jgi:hypothetical protein
MLLVIESHEAWREQHKRKQNVKHRLLVRKQYWHYCVEWNDMDSNGGHRQ